MDLHKRKLSIEQYIDLSRELQEIVTGDALAEVSFSMRGLEMILRDVEIQIKEFNLRVEIAYHKGHDTESTEARIEQLMLLGRSKEEAEKQVYSVRENADEIAVTCRNQARQYRFRARIYKPLAKLWPSFRRILEPLQENADLSDRWAGLLEGYAETIRARNHAESLLAELAQTRKSEEAIYMVFLTGRLGLGQEEARQMIKTPEKAIYGLLDIARATYAPWL